MRNRPGTALAESLVALTTTAILASATLAMLATQIRLATSLSTRTEAADAVTLAANLLGHELRFALPPADIYAAAPDTLAHRAFRATGFVCDTAGTTLFARTTGIRLPDATKDSALVLTASGEWTAAIDAVADAQHPSCPSLPGRMLAVRLADATATAATPGDALLFFEPGSYHLHDRALRWRAGAAGRQPLTAEVIRTTGSAFTRTAHGLHLLLTAPAQAARPTLDLHIRSLQPKDLP